MIIIDITNIMITAVREAKILLLLLLLSLLFVRITVVFVHRKTLLFISLLVLP